MSKPETQGGAIQFICDARGAVSLRAFDDARAELAVYDRVVEAAQLLPLDAFNKDMSEMDAAEFADHAGEFVEAMNAIRTELAALDKLPYWPHLTS